MKRPFTVFCIALAVLSVIRYAAGSPGRDRPLQEAVSLLREEAEGSDEITLSGIVAKCSEVSSGIRLSVDHLTIQRKDNSEQSLFSSLKVTITTEQTKLLPGDEILASGKAVFWEPDSNPGQFDAQSYYFFRNTVCMLSGAQIHMLRPGRPSLARALAAVRRRLGESYRSILEKHQADMMEAVCLGERDLPGQEWKQLYQEGGIAHILAISGLHISLIGMCLYRMLRKLGAPFRLACPVSGAAVVLYVLMTGAGVSAVRALIMFAFWLGAQLWGRKYDMITAGAAAAMLILLQNAGNLSQASFLLSFGAILSAAVLVPCLSRSFRTAADCLSRREASGLKSGGMPASCFGIWLGTLPVTLYFFYQTAPWSILLNLAVVPLMSVLMVYGLLAGGIGLISVPFGIFFAAPSGYLLDGFEFLCHLKEGLPMSVLVTGRPALWRIALYYGILLAAGILSYFLTDERKKNGRPVRGRRARAACLCLLWTACSAACVGLMCVRSQEKLAVTCLDVGQGDASLLRLPGGVSCLIDGGSTSESKVWRYRIGQTVKYYGVRTLDYVFLSHADEDHISGIEEYLQEYEPGYAEENVHGVTLRNLVIPPAADPEDFQELCTLAREKGIQVLQMQAGGVIANTAGGGKAPGGGSGEIRTAENTWRITCLAPASSGLTGDRNENSMVLLLQYGAFRMLFTGDLEGEAERRLAAASGADLKADVLKAGHHGSKNASSDEFLAEVTPRTAVISCGKDNPYGHPAPETLARLQKAGCRVFQTPESGAVMIESDGQTYSVEQYRKE